MENVSPHLSELYADYFVSDSRMDQERASAAVESADAIVRLGGTSLGKTIDVGAGDGVVSMELDRRKLASSIVAAEISSSGIEKIASRTFSTPLTVQQIDGYRLPFDDKAFDTAVCAHVIEHVEHERVFLREIGRVAKQLFLIAPLEGCMRGTIDRRMGHINYYSPLTLKNLVETSGFQIGGSLVFAASAEREQIMHGPVRGRLRNVIRRSVLRVAGNYAPHLMVHVMAIRAVPA